MATWVITGANRGIGLELCKQLKERGEDVIAACRTPSSELDALGVQVVSGVDVTSEAGASTLVAACGDKTIHALVNNAGILVPDSLGSLDFDQIRKSFEVNTVGPLRLTQSLAPKMTSGSRVALVSSRVGSLTDNTSGGMYAYRMSKAALNMAGISLARDLAGRGILVVLLHPGFIRTEMTGGAGNDDPPVAVKGLIARIDKLTPEMSGHFYHASGQELPW